MSKQLIKSVLCLSILIAGDISTAAYAAVGQFSAFSSTEEKPLSFEDELPARGGRNNAFNAEVPLAIAPVEKIKDKPKQVIVKQNNIITPITAPQPKATTSAPQNRQQLTVEAARNLLLEAEQDAERIKLAKLNADKEYLANENRERQLKQQLETAEKFEKEQRLIAERQARIKQKEDAKVKKAAELQARLLAQQQERERERLAKEAQLKAKNEAMLKAQAERKAAIEREAVLKAEAQRKAAADREVMLKAEAERKATMEREAALKAEAQRKATADREVMLKAEAERKSSESNFKKELSVQSSALAQANVFSNQSKYPATYSAAKPIGATPLQRATSVFGVSSAKGSPIRQQILGYSASVDQIKAFDERYKYNVSRMSVLPPQIASIQLNSLVKLNGDQLNMFRTLADKAAVEEYMAYHPLHAEALSNYIKRIMTLNGGQTGGLTVDKALMNELTFNLGGINVPSASLNNAPDQYLYISSRLNENDQAKFWGWINAVRIGDQIEVPSWVKLVDVMYSH